MMKVVFAVFHCLFVVPVAAVRRLFGWEQLKEWGHGDKSAFKVLNKTYVAADFEEMDQQ